MKHTNMFWLSIVLVGIGIFSSGVVFLWAGWAYREWPYERQVNGILEDEVRPGQDYHATVSVIRTKTCALRIHREFYDGTNTRIESRTLDVPGKKGLFKLVEYQVLYQVPTRAKPGQGKVCISLAPQCNFVQAVMKPYLYRSCAQLKILPD